MPEIWALVRPRKGLLALGLILMAINRVSGLVLPYSTLFLIDNVITKHQTKLLVPIVAGVLMATLVQGVTSFTLTQLLSKAAQRLIAELRLKVQQHVGASLHRLLRLESDWRSCVADHVGCGRRAQSYWHRSGGFLGRVTYSCNCSCDYVSHQHRDDPDGDWVSRYFCPGTEKGVW